ncbi:hypothetical protein EVAR_54032_1 [Eumeta japonica]|uniref:Uncharacterized protein n=1 Tax=Eumeta variegata TaxID=151549 RepID=A0A4C1YTY0_EUMVA|nr:hypothetical protein EVAR_54032_1 [Eumeta japonica]
MRRMGKKLKGATHLRFVNVLAADAQRARRDRVSRSSRVSSKPYQAPTGPELAKLCNHKRKLLATLQGSGHASAPQSRGDVTWSGKKSWAKRRRGGGGDARRRRALAGRCARGPDVLLSFISFRFISVGPAVSLFPVAFAAGRLLWRFGPYPEIYAWVGASRGRGGGGGGGGRNHRRRTEPVDSFIQLYTSVTRRPVPSSAANYTGNWSP